jgi:hypothetical protein
VDGARQLVLHATSIYHQLVRDIMKMSDLIKAMQESHAKVQLILCNFILCNE